MIKEIVNLLHCVRDYFDLIHLGEVLYDDQEISLDCNSVVLLAVEELV